jgi:NAD(P)-dependent dehydrogenase (short-subunit alcohol dehydrogenase family)
LGRAIARAFLAVPSEDVVWLAVHARREQAEALATEQAQRCRCVDLDVASRSSWDKAVAEVLARDNRLSTLLAPPGQANYAAAKAGVVALTQSLAKEVGRLGITVNAVCPGFIETEGLADLSAEARQAALAKIPLRRFGRPEEVTAVRRFLACEQAGYITGSVLKIDGGIL